MAVIFILYHSGRTQTTNPLALVSRVVGRRFRVNITAPVLLLVALSFFKFQKIIVTQEIPILNELKAGALDLGDGGLFAAAYMFDHPG